MMTLKITTIKNLAVFQSFEWDKFVLNKDNSHANFKKINILYSRNYSGKTTLSRIIRTMETKYLSGKYVPPEFNVSIKGEEDVNQNTPKKHSKKIRVFNEDFVRDNLKFITNPDEGISVSEESE